MLAHGFRSEFVVHRDGVGRSRFVVLGTGARGLRASCLSHRGSLAATNQQGNTDSGADHEHDTHGGGDVECDASAAAAAFVGVPCVQAAGTRRRRSRRRNGNCDNLGGGAGDDERFVRLRLRSVQSGGVDQPAAAGSSGRRRGRRRSRGRRGSRSVERGLQRFRGQPCSSISSDGRAVVGIRHDGEVDDEAAERHAVDDHHAHVHGQRPRDVEPDGVLE
mmetsp:Transcript_16314/g.50634  ORF Transcript_16314/g.50634 Transcript_16314/m.50634 type:complete len:219 (+) Transcript_16314:733-1389(+)